MDGWLVGIMDDQSRVKKKKEMSIETRVGMRGNSMDAKWIW